MSGGHPSCGFGRKICVGCHMADNSLFISIAVSLWATNIEREKMRQAGFFTRIWWTTVWFLGRLCWQSKIIP